MVGCRVIDTVEIQWGFGWESVTGPVRLAAVDETDARERAYWADGKVYIREFPNGEWAEVSE